MTSYWVRCFQDTLVDLDFSGNAIIDKSPAYFHSTAISYDAGTEPAIAANAMRKINGNHISVTTAATLNRFFECDKNNREGENFLNGRRLLAAPEYTIDAGSITIGDDDFIQIDTEAAAATDDLTTITATYDWHRIAITAASSSRTVVLRDGIGNLALNGDFSLTHGTDRIELIYKAGNAKWAEVSRSDNTL